MSKILLTRLRQGYRTMKYPDAPPPPLADRFRGRPVIDPQLCQTGCQVCTETCPVDAISWTAPDGANQTRPMVDLGRCLFCTDCQRACPTGAISHSADYRLATRQRQDLQLPLDQEAAILAESLEKRIRRLFGRSFKLRQVSAGGCNACEADTNVLGTIGWDLGRFGIQFVASPRHADGLLITGPVTPNMVTALAKTWDAVPEPKLVIATGACAISGGPYFRQDGPQSGAGSHLKIDLFIPGCPPHPLTILDGLLRLIGRIDERKTARS